MLSRMNFLFFITGPYQMGKYSLKIRFIHPLGVNGANLACKQNRKMVKSANLFFAHWAFPSGCAIMWMMIKTHTAGVKEEEYVQQIRRNAQAVSA